jgi:hypothetical protein
MVMVRVTVAAIIIVIMVGIVVSSVTLIISGLASTLAVSLSVVIGRCHRIACETLSTHHFGPDFLILDYRPRTAMMRPRRPAEPKSGPLRSLTRLLEEADCLGSNGRHNTLKEKLR